MSSKKYDFLQQRSGDSARTRKFLPLGQSPPTIIFFVSLRLFRLAVGVICP